MKKPNFKKALPYLIITFFFVGSVAVIAGVTGGIQREDWYRTNHSVPLKILDFNNKSHVIQNDSAKDYFVPNKTGGEWSAFANNLPPNVSLNAVDCSDGVFTAGSDCEYNGYVYPTVQIGSQTWFNEDLQTTDKPDGSALTQWPPSVASASTTRFTCDTNVSSCIGHFYQWDAALNGAAGFLPGASTTPVIQGICPAGWHIPSETDIAAFQATTASCYNSGTTAYSATCLNNNFDFNISLSGYRKGASGSYMHSGQIVFLRSATYDTIGLKFHAHVIMIDDDGNCNDSNECEEAYNSANDGLSVRCVKD